MNSRFLLKGGHTPSSFALPEENPHRIPSPVRHVTFNQQTYRNFLDDHSHIIHHVSRSRGRTRGSREPGVRAYSVFHAAAGHQNETNRLPKARRAVTVHPRGMHIQVPPTPDGRPYGRSGGAGLEPQPINTAGRAVTVHPRGMHIQVPPTPDGRPYGRSGGAGPDPQQTTTTKQYDDRSPIVGAWSEPPPEPPAYAGSPGVDVLEQSRNPDFSEETDEEDGFDPVSLRIPFKNVPTLGLETTFPGDPPKQGLDSDRSSGLTLQAKWEAALYHAASAAVTPVEFSERDQVRVQLVTPKPHSPLDREATSDTGPPTVKRLRPCLPDEFDPISRRIPFRSCSPTPQIGNGDFFTDCAAGTTAPHMLDASGPTTRTGRKPQIAPESHNPTPLGGNSDFFADCAAGTTAPHMLDASGPTTRTGRKPQIVPKSNCPNPQTRRDIVTSPKTNTTVDGSEKSGFEMERPTTENNGNRHRRRSMVSRSAQSARCGERRPRALSKVNLQSAYPSLAGESESDIECEGPRGPHKPTLRPQHSCDTVVDSDSSHETVSDGDSLTSTDTVWKDLYEGPASTCTHPYTRKVDALVTIGGWQQYHSPEDADKYTVVHISVWNQYLKRLWRDGFDTSEWELTKTAPRRKRRHRTKLIETKSGPLPVRGPFAMRCYFDAVERWLNVFVTDEDDAPGVTLGRDAWRPISVWATQAEYPEGTTEASLLEGALLGVQPVDPQMRDLGAPMEVLLDTGATCSVMPEYLLEHFGLTTADLLTTGIAGFRGAGDVIVPVLGMTPDITFRIGSHICTCHFIVSRFLGHEKLILGRDFITKYDIVIDLPRGKVLLRNPNQLYELELEHRIDPTRLALTATPAEVKKLEVAELCKLTMEVSEKRRRGTKGRLHLPLEGGQFYARMNFDTSDPSGVLLGHSIGSVKNGQIEVTASNFNEMKGEQDITESSLSARLYRVKTVRRKRPRRLRRASETLPSVKEMCLESLGAWETASERWGADIGPPFQPADPVDQPPPGKPWKTLPDVNPDTAGMTPEQFERAKKLLESYADIFSKFEGDIGRTDWIEHEIVLEPGATYFRESPRRMTPEKRAIVDKQVKEMLENGIIERCASPYASGVVLVKKPDGRDRFCVDFRKLNAITVKDAYPIPNIQETIEKIGDAKYFSTLDMGSAYWQVPIAEGSKDKTAFVTTTGLYWWLFMPFGLCNAPAAFQRLMNRVLEPMRMRYGDLVLVYLDDILIATQNIDQHLDRLEEVFGRVRAAGLKFKAGKCQLFQTQVKFLGRVISGGGIAMDEAQIEAVQSWKRPKNVRDVQSFLGFMNYYREFIPNFADRASPLTYLTRKNVPFEWTDECEDAFESLKRAAATPPVLALPSAEGHYVLDTDASAVAIAGILHQTAEPLPDGEFYEGENTKIPLRPVCYGARTLDDTQRAYPAAKAEMYAVMHFVDLWRHFIGNKPFTLRVDNSSLIWLKTYSGDTSGLVMRWLMQLNSINFKPIHRPRAKHMNADGLSKKTEHYGNEPANNGPVEEVPFMPIASWRALEPAVVGEGIDPDYRKNPVRKPRTKDANVQTTSCEPETWQDPDLGGPTPTQLAGKHPELLADEGWGPLPVDTANGPVIWDKDHGWQHINVLKLEPTPDQVTLEVAKPSAPYLWDSELSVVPKAEIVPISVIENSMQGIEKDLENRVLNFPHPPLELPVKREHIEEVKLLVTEPRYLANDLIAAQGDDPCMRIYRRILEDERSRGTKLTETELRARFHDMPVHYKTYFTQNRENLDFANGVLVLRRRGDKPALLLPPVYRFQVCAQAHDSAGHRALESTLQRIRTRFDWPLMRKTVAQYIDSCPDCQFYKKQKARRLPLQSIESHGFNDLVQMDFEQVLPSKNSGCRWLLVVIDHYTKWADAYPIKHPNTLATAELFFKNWVCVHGVPKRLQTDQGTQFEAQLFKYFASRLNIAKYHSTAYHPPTQGLVERQNRTLLHMLRVYLSYYENWEDVIPIALYAYRTSVHNTTKMTPYFCLYGQEAPTNLEWLFPDFGEKPVELPATKWVEDKVDQMQFAHEVVRHNTKQAQRRQAVQFNKKIHGKQDVKEGDFVLVFFPALEIGRMQKLCATWRGPFRVEKVLDQEGRKYLIETGKVINYENIRPFHGRPSDLIVREDGKIDFDYDGVELKPPPGLEAIGELTPSQREAASVMNQPIGHLEAKTYNLRNRENAQKKLDTDFYYDLDKAVDANDQLVQPENINTEHEMLINSGRAWLGDNPNQTVYENEIPDGVLTAWAHKQPWDVAGPPPRPLVASDGSSVLPLKQWIEKQRGEGIKPNAFQDLVPAYMTDDTSTEQNASDFKVVHDSGFVDCGESHFNHFNHTTAPPRESATNFNQQPSTLPLDSAAQRPSETRRQIEFEQTHHTYSENNSGNEGVEQSQGRCGPPLYPRDCRRASPELRSECRQGIFDVIRSRNNREISVPAPTQKRRGEGGDMNKVELAPSKFKFDSLPERIQESVRFPVVAQGSRSGESNSEQALESEPQGNSAEEQPSRPIGRQAVSFAEAPLPRDKPKARSEGDVSPECSSSTKRAPHSWPQPSDDITFKGMPSLKTHAMGPGGSVSGQTYATEWRTRSGRVIALIDQPETGSNEYYLPDWSSSASGDRVYPRGDEEESDQELWERVAGSRTQRRARTVLGRTLDLEAMQDQGIDYEYFEENGERPDVDREETESYPTAWLSQSEGDLEESSDDLVSCAEGEDREAPSNSSVEADPLMEFFTPRPSVTELEVPEFGAAAETPTQLREAGGGANMPQTIRASIVVQTETETETETELSEAGGDGSTPALMARPARVRRQPQWFGNRVKALEPINPDDLDPGVEETCRDHLSIVSCNFIRYLNEDGQVHQAPARVTADELAGKQKPLPRVPKSGRFQSLQQFQAIYSQLLREECLRGTRELLQSLSPERELPDQLNIYSPVKILGRHLSGPGVSMLVELPPPRLKSKQLWFGNLVYFVKDGKVRASATVLSIDKDSWPDVDLLHVALDGSHVQGLHTYREMVQTPDKYDLIESPVYVRAYESAIRWMLEGYRCPLWETLSGGATAGFPVYLTSRDSFDISRLYPEQTGSVTPGRMIELLAENPPAFETLDPSQSRAVAHALSSSVAIIQGPPGCGKTHTGVTILSMLLELRPETRGTIVVSAYRNKALNDLVTKAVYANPKHGFARLGRKVVEPTTVWDLCNLEMRLRVRPTDAYREAVRRSNGVASGHHQRMGRMYNLALRHSGEPESILRQLKVRVSQDDLEELRAIYDKKNQLKDFDVIASWILGPSVGMCERPLESGWTVARDPPEDSKLTPRLLRDAKGIRRRVEERINQAKWFELGEAIELADEAAEEVQNVRRALTAAALQTVDVVAATVTYLNIHRQVFEELRPKIVIFEEAGEILDPLAIAALPSSVEHVILLGDHQQLAPRVQVQSLTKRGFGISLMQRLVDAGIPSVRLDYQNRMRPELADPLRGIYPGLKDGMFTKDIQPVSGLKNNIFWWEVESEEKPAYSNRDEALAVWSCVGLFLQLNVSPNEIAILTPYSEQESLISEMRKRRDKDHRFREVHVSTVDSFQGDERPVVVISLVRSNQDGKVGFLSDSRRRCVAMSRARSALIYVGDPKTICRDKGWKATHSFLESRGCSNKFLDFTCPVHDQPRSLSLPAVRKLTLTKLFGIPECDCVCTAFDSAIFNPPTT